MDRVVTDNVKQLRVIARKRIRHIRAATTPRRLDAGRRAARIERRSTRTVERQAQTENATFTDFSYALEDLLWRQQIEPSKLIVGAEVAPV